jgi:hypothetical protein
MNLADPKLFFSFGITKFDSTVKSVYNDYLLDLKKKPFAIVALIKS